MWRLELKQLIEPLQRTWSAVEKDECHLLMSLYYFEKKRVEGTGEIRHGRPRPLCD